MIDRADEIARSISARYYDHREPFGRGDMDAVMAAALRVAILAEREACAKIAEDWARWAPHDAEAQWIANEIRARPAP